MLSICIGYNRRNIQWLTLPAERSEVLETLGKLMETNGWEEEPAAPYILAATSEIYNLPAYLEGYSYSVPESMDLFNLFAARIAWLNTEKRDIFSKALALLEPSSLNQLIDLTYHLDYYEIKGNDLVQKEGLEQKTGSGEKNEVQVPYDMETAFFLHLHTHSSPGASSFALHLPDKEELWEDMERWVGTDKPSEIRSMQCGGVFGELWNCLPVSSTWRQINAFAKFLMKQEMTDRAAYVSELTSLIESGRPQTMDEVFHLISGTTIRKTDEKMNQTRWFSPLSGEMFYYNQRGKVQLFGGVVTQRELLCYQREVESAITHHKWLEVHPKGFVELLDNMLLRQKVVSMVPKVEQWKGKLWGVLEIRSRGELLPEELHVLKRHWNGLAAGGWGYEFRNRGIKTEDGELHVGFWSSGAEYCILEEEELKGDGIGQGIKGMTLG